MSIRNEVSDRYDGNVFTSGAVERGIREGHRLRGEAMREIFGAIMRDGFRSRS